MAYTVNKLAKLSGVSVRTLHFYDEIGLLRPAYYGDNNYRYYEEEQLLLLQQILFYRELGFPLVEIEKVVKNSDFNKIEALISHKERLKGDLDKTKKLIKTVDKTIAHLRGEITMRNEELYYGFDSEKQKQCEIDLVNDGVVSQEWMNQYKEKIGKWSEKDKASFTDQGKDIHQALMVAIHKNQAPSSKEVQEIIKRHYAWISHAWGQRPTKDAYIGLSQQYLTPGFKAFYDKLDPKLLNFIVEAMGIFAENNL